MKRRWSDFRATRNAVMILCLTMDIVTALITAWGALEHIEDDWKMPLIKGCGLILAFTIICVGIMAIMDIGYIMEKKNDRINKEE